MVNPVVSTTAETKKYHSKDFAFVLDDENDDKSVSSSHEDKLAAANSHEDDENDNSGLGLEIDLDDDHDEHNAATNDDEDTNANDDSDSDCYSLGDISEIEGSGNDAASSASHHVARTIAIVAIVLIAVGAAAFAFLSKSSDDSVDREGEIANAVDDSVQNDQLGNTQEEKPIDEALQPAAEPAEPEPIQPSRAAERNVLMRGIARACMESSIRDMNAGNLDVAQTNVDFALAQNDTLSERDAEQLTQLRDQLAAFQNIWESAQNAGQKCDKIDDLLAQLPEAASGMKEKLNDIEKKCRRKLEAPPTTL